MSLLPEIQKLLLAYWSHIAVALVPFSLYLVTKYWRKQRHATLNSNKTLHDADLRMVEAAVSIGLSEAQASYLRGYIAPDLAKLTIEGASAKTWETRVGLVALVATPISSAITGVGISIPGLVDTVKFSFFVTSIGSMAAGILVFCGWGAKAIQKTELARKVRDEIWQFTAGACEYRGLTLDDAWATLSRTLSEWIYEDITAESKAASKREKAQEAAKKEEEGEKDEEKI